MTSSDDQEKLFQHTFGDLETGIILKYSDLFLKYLEVVENGAGELTLRPTTEHTPTLAESEEKDTNETTDGEETEEKEEFRIAENLGSELNDQLSAEETGSAHSSEMDDSSMNDMSRSSAQIFFLLAYVLERIRREFETLSSLKFMDLTGSDGKVLVAAVLLSFGMRIRAIGVECTHESTRIAEERISKLENCLLLEEGRQDHSVVIKRSNCLVFSWSEANLVFCAPVWDSDIVSEHLLVHKLEEKLLQQRIGTFLLILTSIDAVLTEQHYTLLDSSERCMDKRDRVFARLYQRSNIDDEKEKM